MTARERKKLKFSMIHPCLALLAASRCRAEAIFGAASRSRPSRESFTAERISETIALYPGPLVT